MPNNTTVQMYSTAFGDSAATIDVPDDGTIENVIFTVAAKSLDADGDGAQGELNFGSTNQMTTNDARAVIAHAAVSVGDIQTAENTRSEATVKQTFPDGLPVFAGERIHLHWKALGGGVALFTLALITFKFRKFTARRR